MSRVEEERDAQRIEDARIAQQQQQTKARQNSDTFKKLVGKQQAAQQQASQRGNSQKNNAQQNEKQTANQMLAARSGIRGQSLAESLHKKGDESVRKSGEDLNARAKDMKEKREKVEERFDSRRSDARLEGERVDSRTGAIDPDEGQQGGGNSGGGGASSDGGGAKMGMQGQAGGSTLASETGGANAPRLPQAVIDALVDRVFAGKTPLGDWQMTVELKGSVLSGARFHIVASGSSIKCEVFTDDKNVGRLIKASEKELSKAFERKGLYLKQLAVV